LRARSRRGLRSDVMNATSKTFALALVAAAIACKKDDKPAPQATAESAAPAVVASAAPSATVGRRPHVCPSRVRGATATASDVDGGVMISVTAGDDTAVGEIQTRAQALGAAPPPEGRRGHFCAEMEEGTTRTIATTPKGVQITLVPTNASDLAHVRSDVREHLARGEKRFD
jgi:hypothetical protein